MVIEDEKREGRSQEMTTTTRQVQHEEQEDDLKEDDWKESSSLASCLPSISSSPFISFPSPRSHHQTRYEDHPCHDQCFSSDSLSLHHYQQQPSLDSSCTKSVGRRRQSSRQPSSSIPVIFTLFIVIVSFVILELFPNLFSKSANIFLFTSASSSSQAERRLSSRIVTTKYGALRGFLVSLPNRGLEPVEVFMGKNYIITLSWGSRQEFLLSQTLFNGRRRVYRVVLRISFHFSSFRSSLVPLVFVGTWDEDERGMSFLVSLSLWSSSFLLPVIFCCQDFLGVTVRKSAKKSIRGGERK